MLADISDNILEVSGEKWLRWFGHAKKMPLNKLPRRISEKETEVTNKEMPEVSREENDGVGLTMD